jgi:5'(3')-deoxyribonucleotidase
MLREILPNSPYTKDGPLGQESTSWEYIKDHIDPEHWDWLWTEGVRLGLFRHGHMYPGTIKAVRDLNDMGDVIIITHRPRAAVLDTMDWLTYHRLPVAGVHILTGGEPKSSVKHCDFFIDDKPENCIDMLQHSSTVVAMPTREWNSTFLHPKVEVVSGLDEFVKLVEHSK